MFICLHLSIYIYIYIYIYLSISLYLYLSIYLYLPIYMYVHTHPALEPSTRVYALSGGVHALAPRAQGIRPWL